MNCFQELEDLFGKPIGTFKPHVTVFDEMRMVRVLVKDCSYCAKRVSQIFEILNENHVGQVGIVGFHIWSADEVVRRVIAIRQGLWLRIDIIPLDHLLVVTQAIGILGLRQVITEGVFEKARALAKQHALALTREQYEPLLS